MVKLDSKWIAACIYRLLAVIPCWSCTQVLSIQIKEHQCGCIKAVVVMKPTIILLMNSALHLWENLCATGLWYKQLVVFFFHLCRFKVHVSIFIQMCHCVSPRFTIETIEKKPSDWNLRSDTIWILEVCHLCVKYFMKLWQQWQPSEATWGQAENQYLKHKFRWVH